MVVKEKVVIWSLNLDSSRFMYKDVKFQSDDAKLWYVHYFFCVRQKDMSFKKKCPYTVLDSITVTELISGASLMSYHCYIAGTVNVFNIHFSRLHYVFRVALDGLSF